jgi:hypothetical protein
VDRPFPTAYGNLRSMLTNCNQLLWLTRRRKKICCVLLISAEIAAYSAFGHPESPKFVIKCDLVHTRQKKPTTICLCCREQE